MTPRAVAACVACACLLLMEIATPASGARFRGHGPVEIVRPSLDSFHTGPVLPLRVRAARGAHVEARLDGRRVRLRRRGGALVTKLRRSRLGPGPHRLSVDARVGRRSLRRYVRFRTAGRRRGSLLRVSASGRPLRVAARVPDRRARLVATLNGTPVGDQFTLPGPGPRRASLSASEGLRHGRNVLRLTAYRLNGDYATVTRTIRVARTRPLAGAGRDRPAAVRRRVVLDARRSRSARRGRLRYRWAIADAPRGSRARLRGAHARRALLRPDRRGTYRLRVTVSERGEARAAAGSASDVVTVSAQPTDAPIGVPIDTYVPGVAGAPDAIVVGDQSYISFPAGGGYQVLVLDRTGPQGGTLTVLANDAIPFGAETDLSEVWANVDGSPLVIITATPGNTATGTAAFNSEIAAIGGAPVASLQAGVSVVGIPGQASGQAYVYAPSGPNLAPFQGISGYLSKDSTAAAALNAAYVLAPSDYIEYTLGTPNASSPIVIECTVAPNCPVTASFEGQANGPGFGLLVVDAYTLEKEFSLFYGLADLQNLADTLQALASDPTKLVFLKSIGEPAPNDPLWGAVSVGIQGLGGNRHTFNTFNTQNLATGTQDYGLVSGAGNVAQGDDLVGAPGSFLMSGVLNRQSNWQFAPMLSDPLGSVDYSLTQIPYQLPNQPNPFPVSTGPYAAAEADLAAALACTTSKSCTVYPDIRSQYWLNSDVTSWTALVAEMQAVEYPRGASYKIEQWRELQNHLALEFPLVDHATTLTSDIYALYGGGNGQVTADLQTIAAAITAKVAASQNNEQSQVMATIGDAMSGLSGIPGFGEAFGAVGSAFDIASAWTTDGNGNRELIAIEGLAANVGETLNGVQENAQFGLARLQAIFVSDWGKLQAAAQVGQGIDLSSGAPAYTAGWQTLALAGRRTIWTTIIGASFQAASPHCDIIPGNPPALWDYVSGWRGSPGSLSAESQTWVTLGALPSNGAPLFAEPTWGDGDINAGMLPQDYYLENPYHVGIGC